MKKGSIRVLECRRNPEVELLRDQGEGPRTILILCKAELRCTKYSNVFQFLGIVDRTNQQAVNRRQRAQ